MSSSEFNMVPPISSTFFSIHAALRNYFKNWLVVFINFQTSRCMSPDRKHGENTAHKSRRVKSIAEKSINTHLIIRFGNDQAPR